MNFHHHMTIYLKQKKSGINSLVVKKEELIEGLIEELIEGLIEDLIEDLIKDLIEDLIKGLNKITINILNLNLKVKFNTLLFIWKLFMQLI